MFARIVDVLRVFKRVALPFLSKGSLKEILLAMIVYLGVYPSIALGLAFIGLIALTSCTDIRPPFGTADFSVLPKLEPPLTVPIPSESPSTRC